MHLKFILIFIFLLASISSSLGNIKKDIYRWPSSGLLKLNSETVDTEFDGQIFKEVLIYNSKFKLKLPPLKNWKAFADSKGSSITFAYSTAPDLKLEFCLFKKDYFLPNLDEETLNAYTAGLRSKYKQTLTFLNEGNFLQKNSSFIAGEPYRLIQYKIDKPKEDTIFVEEYLLFIEDFFLIIRLSGPQELFQKSAPIIKRALSQAYP